MTMNPTPCIHARHIVVVSCTAPDCRCLDARGVILYDGYDAVAASEAEAKCPPGYALDHARREGLCPSCREDWETDPEAWEEFGFHPRGMEAMRKHDAEVAAWEAAHPAEPMVDDPAIPF